MSSSPWFMCDGTESEPGPAARVYCFPHAGGNPRSFLGWQSDLAGVAEIAGLCPPGRGNRYREPALTDVAELADAVAHEISATADRPFVLFGHSFGAVLAFEVARRIGHLPDFRHLVASGCSAPSLLPTRRVVEAARLEGREFTEAVGFFGGLPPEVMADESLQELLLPNLRADFRMVAGYAYRPAAPLSVPVTLINGTDDPHISEAGLQPWERECLRPPARHRAEGGHFYFDGRSRTVTDILRSLLPAAPGAGQPGDWHVELI
ncbi:MULTISPECIES: thioesterase II family protein [unclassified Streptomyces]|uniref:thioesterase II family protein n=1 Tax=unclassified Streptomyces TaxID=2593676 RepID=UPI00214CE66D|nr:MULTISPECIES: alpha/beta fold hydrolase [unclassified Streptomyces]UUU39504.1 alpha/beta fold hydrolase [Streptomyces sp. NBC_00162]